MWFGVSVENQKTADERIPLLLKCPAVVRWISAEPLLGPVLLDNGESSWLSCTSTATDPDGDSEEHCCESFHVSGAHFRGIDWVVCGGESGPGARPMHPEWALSLRDQCQAAGVPYLFKQWGEWAPLSAMTTDHTVKFHRFDDGAEVYLMGKHAAGRELDGRTWDEYPEVSR